MPMLNGESGNINAAAASGAVLIRFNPFFHPGRLPPCFIKTLACDFAPTKGVWISLFPSVLSTLFEHDWIHHMGNLGTRRGDVKAKRWALHRLASGQGRWAARADGLYRTDSELFLLQTSQSLYVKSDQREACTATLWCWAAGKCP